MKTKAKTKTSLTIKDYQSWRPAAVSASMTADGFDARLDPKTGRAKDTYNQRARIRPYGRLCPDLQAISSEPKARAKSIGSVISKMSLLEYMGALISVYCSLSYNWSFELKVSAFLHSQYARTIFVLLYILIEYAVLMLGIVISDNSIDNINRFRMLKGT
jgi:hypothetical protein